MEKKRRGEKDIDNYKLSKKDGRKTERKKCYDIA